MSGDWLAQEHFTQLQREWDALLAENQQLREALRQIDEAAANVPDRDIRVQIRDIARHALARVEKSE